MKPFFLVLAKDQQHINKKIIELNELKVPFKIICGEYYDHPNVIYRKPIGKYDAINYGLSLLPDNIEIVVLNDVDTEIVNFFKAINYMKSNDYDLVFIRTEVTEGPQIQFYKIQDAIRRHLLIAADGECMIIKYGEIKKILPIRPCKAEDTYILFEFMKRRLSVDFYEGSHVITKRTTSARNEELYKRKTTTGIYQALFYVKPPLPTFIFYILLPFASPLLLIMGKKGYFWMRGIIFGFLDFIRGDRRGYWSTDYMEN